MSKITGEAIAYTLFHQDGTKTTTSLSNVNEWWNDKVQFYLSGDKLELFNWDSSLKRWVSTLKF